MARAKRVAGSRPAPILPLLSESDYKPWLWEAVRGVWTLEQAAFYIFEKIPDSNISSNPAAFGKTGQIYLWLRTEYDQGRLYAAGDYNPALFSPGMIMRHLWEHWRHVSLVVWALYDAAETGILPNAIKTGISRQNYLTAADTVRSYFPAVTKAELVHFLCTLPDNLKRNNGLPYFTVFTPEYISKFLKNAATGKAGRRKASETQILAGHEIFLMGHISEILDGKSGQ